MVGKPNFPSDVDQRDDLLGMSMPTAGLTPLDQEREASMADEGGKSGAVMESQDGDTLRSPTSRRPYPTLASLDARTQRPRWIALAMAIAGGVLVVLGLARRRH